MSAILVEPKCYRSDGVLSGLQPIILLILSFRLTGRADAMWMTTM